MDHIKKIWHDQIANNAIENLTLEIYLATRLTPNIISYELTSAKFNEILADVALMQIWTEWNKGSTYKYYLNDMIMTVDEEGHMRVSINKTLSQIYLTVPDDTFSGFQHISDIPKITNIRVHHDDIPSKKNWSLKREIKKQETASNLHIKCIRKIPLGITSFPPYNKYHQTERITFRYYRNGQFGIYFMINVPKTCLKDFDDLLVNCQNSQLFIKIVIYDLSGPLDHISSIMSYLGWQNQ